MKNRSLELAKHDVWDFFTVFIVLGMSFFSPNLFAQEKPLNKADLVDSAFAMAVRQYDNAIGKNAFIFTGEAYFNRFAKLRGDQFFIDNYWEIGAVDFGGQHYENIYMKYDVLSDQLVLEHFTSSGIMASIELYKPDVSGFNLFGHEFIRLNKDTLSNLKEGFYDLLIKDFPVQLLAKRVKEITKSTSQSYLVINDKFYIKKDNIYHIVRNKRSALKVLIDKKKELKKYVKSNDLFYLVDKESSFVQLVEYYNSIAG